MVFIGFAKWVLKILFVGYKNVLNFDSRLDFDEALVVTLGKEKRV